MNTHVISGRLGLAATPRQPNRLTPPPLLIGHQVTNCRTVPSRKSQKQHTNRPPGLQCTESERPELPSDSQALLWDRLCHLSETLSQNFATLVAISCSIALFWPAPFLWFTSDMVTVALAVSMVSMGCTLKVEDFAVLAQNPFRIVAGVILQYTVMPITGFCISRLAQLSAPVAAGTVLVACCPGGVASNIVTYLAGGDVALSVAMTSASTLLAVGLTPALTTRLIGTLVAVDGWALFMSTVQVILLPLVIGIMLKSTFPRLIKEVQKIAPLIAVMAVTGINCSITARNAAAILQSGMAIAASVACLHLTGFTLGYLLPYWLEISLMLFLGMQNSGLGAVLAMKHLGDPLSSCVCVVSACFHSVMGGIIASFVRKRLELS